MPRHTPPIRYTPAARAASLRAAVDGPGTGSAYGPKCCVPYGALKHSCGTGMLRQPTPSPREASTRKDGHTRPYTCTPARRRCVHRHVLNATHRQGNDVGLRGGSALDERVRVAQVGRLVGADAHLHERQAEGRLRGHFSWPRWRRGGNGSQRRRRARQRRGRSCRSRRRWWSCGTAPWRYAPSLFLFSPRIAPTEARACGRRPPRWWCG
jgi:hypothetical protein